MAPLVAIAVTLGIVAGPACDGDSQARRVAAYPLEPHPWRIAPQAAQIASNQVFVAQVAIDTSRPPLNSSRGEPEPALVAGAVYDVASDGWQLTATLDLSTDDARGLSLGSTADGTAALVVHGTGDVARYFLDDDRWEPMPVPPWSDPPGLRFGGAVLDDNRLLLVEGGLPNTGFRVYLVDLEDWNAELLLEHPDTPRQFLVLARAPWALVYAPGGGTGYAVHIDSGELREVSILEGTGLGIHPTDQLWQVGDYDDSSDEAASAGNRFQLVNLADGEVQMRTPLPLNVGRSSVVVLRDERVLWLGGFGYLRCNPSASGDRECTHRNLRETWLCSRDGREVRQRFRMHEGRSGQSAVELDDGRVFIVGGLDAISAELVLP